MTDYISREWLLNEYDRRHKGTPGGARAMIEKAPAADVRPVVRGTWVYDDEDTYPHCSECLTQENGRRNFCPNCGADMRQAGGAKENEV